MHLSSMYIITVVQVYSVVTGASQNQIRTSCPIPDLFRTIFGILVRIRTKSRIPDLCGPSGWESSICETKLRYPGQLVTFGRGKRKWSAWGRHGEGAGPRPRSGNEDLKQCIHLDLGIFFTVNQQKLFFRIWDQIMPELTVQLLTILITGWCRPG